MAQFWTGAALLSGVALAFVIAPLWRQHRTAGGWSRLGSLAAALLVPSAVGLYLGIGTWDGQPAPGAAAMPPMTELVESLDARLQERPDDPAGWYLLGQSYMTLNRYDDAKRAFREGLARDLAPGADMKLAFAEAEALTNPQALLGEAGQIFEDALEVEPDNATALWYGGLTAAATERPDVARARWTRLLQLDPPEALRNVLQQHIDAIGGPVDEAGQSVRLAQSDDADGSTRPADGPVPNSNAPRTEIWLRIRLGDGIGAEALDSPGAALFLFARAPEGGPPVAAIREDVSAIPGEFSLSDANNMLPGRSLTDFDALTVVARISLSGQPTGQTGDLYGETRYVAGAGGILDLVIDQVVD